MTFDFAVLQKIKPVSSGKNVKAETWIYKTRSLKSLELVLIHRSELLWIWIISSLIIQAIKAVHFRLSSRRIVRFLIESKITRQNLLSCFHYNLFS